MHLWAFTWGLRRSPGRADAIVARFELRTEPSTRRAGVVRSLIFMSGPR